MEVGIIRYNSNRSKMWIIEQLNYSDIIVKFEDGYTTETTYKKFIDGKVKNPFDRTVCYVGYLGIGEYTPTKNGKSTLAYDTWKNMIRRCYEGKFRVPEVGY